MCSPTQPAPSLRPRCAAAGAPEAPPAAAAAPAEGAELELTCRSLGFGGRGVCHAAGSRFVVFVPFALPGEVLRARVTRVHARHADAARTATLAPAPHAVAPPCPHFGDCGGCALQHLSYDAQLAAKAAQVADAFARIARVRLADCVEPGDAPQLLPALGAPPAGRLRYRNKVAFTWAAAPGGAPRLGLLREGRSVATDAAADALVDVQACLLQHPAADAVLASARAYAEAHAAQLPAFASAAGTGLLRRLTIRSCEDAAHPGGVRLQVDIGTAASRPQLLAGMAAHLAAAHPEIVSVVNSVDPPEPPQPAGAGNASSRRGRRSGGGAAAAAAASPTAGGVTHALHGPPRLELLLGGLRFAVSSRSFFQVNPARAEALLRAVARAAALTGRETVLDLFCGTGALGLSLAAQCKALHGWEACPSAVADARDNAAANGIANATFHAGDLARLGAELGRAVPAPDVIVLDPARAGLAPPLLAHLRACPARRLVYVSCNPATQARDVAALCDAASAAGGTPYHLRTVQPVDMFPHTPHIEAVALLTRD